jgi:hypothetical protein
LQFDQKEDTWEEEDALQPPAAVLAEEPQVVRAPAEKAGAGTGGPKRRQQQRQRSEEGSGGSGPEARRLDYDAVEAAKERRNLQAFPDDPYRDIARPGAYFQIYVSCPSRKQYMGGQRNEHTCERSQIRQPQQHKAQIQ